MERSVSYVVHRGPKRPRFILPTGGFIFYFGLIPRSFYPMRKQSVVIFEQMDLLSFIFERLRAWSF